MTQQGTVAQMWWQRWASVSRSPTAQPASCQRDDVERKGERTSTVEVEMDWPHLALDFPLLAGGIAFILDWFCLWRHIHSHADLTLILLPSRDCCLTYSAYTGRVLCRIAI